MTIVPSSHQLLLGDAPPPPFQFWKVLHHSSSCNEVYLPLLHQNLGQASTHAMIRLSHYLGRALLPLSHPNCCFDTSDACCCLFHALTAALTRHILMGWLFSADQDHVGTYLSLLWSLLVIEAALTGAFTSPLPHSLQLVQTCRSMLMSFSVSSNPAVLTSQLHLTRCFRLAFQSHNDSTSLGAQTFIIVMTKRPHYR